MLSLVIYDITDDKARGKLAETLQNYGLTRIQYSAFKGELHPQDRIVLENVVRQFVKDPHDSIYIIPLCKNCVRLVKIVSKTPTKLIKSSTVDFV